jgi:nitric oxide dioxygenase
LLLTDPIVHDYLMAAVGKVLGDAVTPDIAGAWSEAVLFLARVLIEAEEVVYKEAAERSGGWRGFQPFEIVAVEEIAAAVKRFTFAPAQSATVNDGGFNFVPGQFISVRLKELCQGELTAPRHYTITSAPGEQVLSCSVKKVETGVTSRYLHEQINVGDTVELSPPFGCFTSRRTGEYDRL